MKGKGKQFTIFLATIVFCSYVFANEFNIRSTSNFLNYYIGQSVDPLSVLFGNSIKPFYEANGACPKKDLFSLDMTNLNSISVATNEQNCIASITFADDITPVLSGKKIVLAPRLSSRTQEKLFVNYVVITDIRDEAHTKKPMSEGDIVYLLSNANQNFTGAIYSPNPLATAKKYATIADFKAGHTTL